jgi:hypothetical protein
VPQRLLASFSQVKVVTTLEMAAAGISKSKINRTEVKPTGTEDKPTGGNDFQRHRGVQ